MKTQSKSILQYYHYLTPQDLKHKITKNEQDLFDIEKQITHIHVQLKLIKDTPSNAANFGKQVTNIQQLMKKLEDNLKRLESDIDGVKEQWISNLLVTGVKHKISVKIPQLLNKVQSSLDKVDSSIAKHDHNCSQVEELVKYLGTYDGYPEAAQIITSSILSYKEKKNSLYQSVKDIAEQIKGFQVGTKDQDIEFLSNQVEQLSSIKENLSSFLYQMQGDISSQDNLLYIMDDFGLTDKAELLYKEHITILKDLINRSEDSFNSFRSAMQMQQLSEQDDDVVQQLKDVELEMEEIIQSIKDIKNEQQNLENDITALNTNVPIIKNATVGQIEEFNKKVTSYRDIQNNLLDQVYNLHSDVELKKIEISTNNIKFKLDITSQTLDTLKEQFTEQNEKSVEVFEFVDMAKQYFDQSTNNYSKLVSLQIQQLQSEINTLEDENVMEMFSDAELKINEIMNFWSEKQSSGEGIENPDDAKFLMDEVQNLEDQYIQLELKVNTIMIKNQMLQKKFTKLLDRACTFLIQMIDVYIQSKRVVDMFVKLKDMGQSEQSMKKYNTLKEQFEKFHESINDDDQIDEPFKETVLKISQNMQDIHQKLVRINSQLEEFSKTSQMTLEWSEDGSKLMLVRSSGDIKEYSQQTYDFQITDPQNDLQKILKDKENENPHQKLLPIHNIQANIYQIGSEYKSEIKLIGDILCISLNGGFIPFEEFIRTQYLDIIQDTIKPEKDIRELVTKLRPLVIGYSQ